MEPIAPERAYGTRLGGGRIRSRMEDFRVDEDLGFEASGKGEHVLLQVEKTGCNTFDVAKVLARHSGTPIRHVGYSGLKDKHAVCTQWFTVPFSSRVDWTALSHPGMRILRVERHRRKLKRGTHRANRFRIRVKIDYSDRSALENVLERIFARGVPNYFGEQRFGNRYAGNVNILLKGNHLSRFERGMTLSAVRSELFNRILDRRVREQSWDTALEGEYLNLDGTRSGFAARTDDPDIRSRVEAMDLHPTGPLFGAGATLVSGEVATLEDSVLGPHRDLCDLLIREGLKMERRPTRCNVRDFDYRLDQADGILQLAFTLGRGQYATSVLREILVYEDVTRPGAPGREIPK